MPRTRLNPQRVKIHQSYTTDEAAQLLGVHKNTVRAWLRSGLTALDTRRPILILGSHLKLFLERRRRTSKRSCRPGTMFCLKCRQARQPAAGMVDFIAQSATHGNLRALCGECEAIMHRCVRVSSIAMTMPGIGVTVQARGATTN